MQVVVGLGVPGGAVRRASAAVSPSSRVMIGRHAKMALGRLGHIPRGASMVNMRQAFQHFMVPCAPRWKMWTGVFYVMKTSAGVKLPLVAELPAPLTTAGGCARTESIAHCRH